jgi:tetratricopeptide (TPR) repeat protein
MREQAGALTNAAMLLWSRYRQSGDPRDLEEAVRVGRDAVAATPDGDPQRAGRRSNLAVALLARFARAGSEKDLNEAIGTLRDAVRDSQEKRPDRATILANLGTALESRYARAGQPADLGEAIDVMRSAVDGTSPDDAVAAWRWSNLGAALRIRFEQIGDGGDLEEAIITIRKADRAATGFRPLRAAILSNLGVALRAHFERTADPADLAEAVDAERRAADLISASRPDSASYLSGLGNALLTRFDQTGDPADLAEAIRTGRSAVHATPADQPSRATYLFNLGNALLTRFERTGSAAYVGEAIAAYADAANTASASPLIRIDAARAAAPIAAYTDPTLAAALLDTAVRLLPQIAPRQLTRPDKQYALSGFAFLASDAAALTLQTTGSASRALGLLELGRAVLHSQVLDTRSDLTDLRAQHPELAARFLELCDQLDPAEGVGSVPSVGAPALAGAPDRHHVAAELAALLGRIRHLDGFETFLLPPEPDQLTRHADRGPIVVFSISRYRSDAITITPQAITHVRLPDLALDTLNLKIDGFGQALAVATRPKASDGERTKAAVLAHLAQAGLAHFACHATNNATDPSRSKLLLLDHPLTVASLATIRLDHVQLAYLSACQTSRNASMALLDEAIHLTSAFQLAGFPHVIGTLWKIDDPTAGYVTDVFYRHLQTEPSVFDTTACARALHGTIRGLRDELRHTPSRWATCTREPEEDRGGRGGVGAGRD